MTSHVGRLYALAGCLLVFFVLWAAIAAHPWHSSAARADPRLLALQQREHRIRAESVQVKRILARRFAAYRVALTRREAKIGRARALIRLRAQQAAAQRAVAAQAAAQAAAAVATAPAPTPSAPAAASYSAPRVVTLPPITITRTS
jgi:hypothetical protein